MASFLLWARGKGIGTLFLVSHGVVTDYALGVAPSNYALTWALPGTVCRRLATRDLPVQTAFTHQNQEGVSYENAIVNMLPVLQVIERWGPALQGRQYAFPGGVIIPKTNIGASEGSVPTKPKVETGICFGYFDMRPPPGVIALDKQRGGAGGRELWHSGGDRYISPGRREQHESCHPPTSMFSKGEGHGDNYVTLAESSLEGCSSLLAQDKIASLRLVFSYWNLSAEGNIFVPRFAVTIGTDVSHCRYSEWPIDKSGDLPIMHREVKPIAPLSLGIFPGRKAGQRMSHLGWDEILPRARLIFPSQAECRGFKSHHPLSKPAYQAGFVLVECATLVGTTSRHLACDLEVRPLFKKGGWLPIAFYPSELRTGAASGLKSRVLPRDELIGFESATALGIKPARKGIVERLWALQGRPMMH